MARRIHVPLLQIGPVPLDAAQAHHVRDVLRLPNGATVEAFDQLGNIATGALQYQPDGVALVVIENISANSREAGCKLFIAAAIPKGDRADWMVEKLSELGVSQFIPLATARGVVIPEGRNKIERWNRIAIEAAKQSQRHGVMIIAPVTTVAGAIAESIKSPTAAACVMATEVPGVTFRSLIDGSNPPDPLTVFIGPEGGWTGQELQLFAKAKITAARLSTPILRIETAAIAVAAIMNSLV